MRIRRTLGESEGEDGVVSGKVRMGEGGLLGLGNGHGASRDRDELVAVGPGVARQHHALKVFQGMPIEALLASINRTNPFLHVWRGVLSAVGIRAAIQHAQPARAVTIKVVRKDLEHFRTRIEACLPCPAEDASLRFRAMFGGAGAYAHDVMFASLSDVGLALKFSPADQQELLAMPGVERLRYAPDAPPSKQYLLVPEDVLNDDQALGAWLSRSITWARSNPARTRRARPSRAPAHA